LVCPPARLVTRIKFASNAPETDRLEASFVANS